MTPKQIGLVQGTWQSVFPIQDEAARLFYGRLFELDPTLKPLFKSDMAEQRRKLMQMIGAAVNALDRLDTIVPAVRELGKRHVKYGVRDEHYSTVGAALLWTLEQGLGQAFSPEVKSAWTVAYTVLADTMKAAADEETSSAGEPLAASAMS
jgi:hemoglobin-like flavoprotein